MHHTPSAPAPQPSTAHRQGLRALERDLESALLGWRARLCGAETPSPLSRLAPLLAPVRAVGVQALPNEDLAVFEGERLLFDEVYFHHVVARYADPRERLLHALLYAAHEVIHHIHHLNGKPTVLQVRAVSEGLLMEFDLEADHHAALVVAELTGEDLLALKRRQVECLSSFPVTAAHAPGARRRKAGRYVSLCAEVRARELGLLEGGGFLVASWEAGRALLVERAALMGVLCVGTLGEEDRVLLEGAMDEAPEGVFAVRRAAVEEVFARAWGMPRGA